MHPLKSFSWIFKNRGMASCARQGYEHTLVHPLQVGIGYPSGQGRRSGPGPGGHAWQHLHGPGFQSPLPWASVRPEQPLTRNFQVDAKPHTVLAVRAAHPYLHFYKSHCQTVKCILPSDSLGLTENRDKTIITNVIRCLHISKSLQIKCLMIVLG